MDVIQTINEVKSLVKKARSDGKTIGFVPTMGALHEGHLSLIRAANEKCDFVVVSIFVNPTQFGPSEDLDKYPRPIEKDIELCEKNNVDLVFNPTVEQMYKQQNLTWVNVEKITECLCGSSRPNHFRGVTTVCAKLFNIVKPDFAFFGQKDAQQAVVIKRMVCDLNMDLEIVVCPIVRAADGIALSSRNAYLTPEQRKDAALLYKSLQNCRQLIEKGEKNSQTITDQIRTTLSESPLIKVEYISIVDFHSLEDIGRVSAGTLIAVAIRIANTRLIDNILVD
ncbi:MAG: pantoate--beta-alanine ligase [Planctomycetes bacterium]|nr:pantoate--beta-alanine ligase [Planctomycetota bacterium]